MGSHLDLSDRVAVGIRGVNIGQMPGSAERQPWKLNPSAVTLGCCVVCLWSAAVGWIPPWGGVLLCVAQGAIWGWGELLHPPFQLLSPSLPLLQMWTSVRTTMVAASRSVSMPWAATSANATVASSSVTTSTPASTAPTVSPHAPPRQQAARERPRLGLRPGVWW